MKEPRTIYEEQLMNCINLARDGIHAFLLVVSILVPQSTEQRDIIQSLQKLFGRSSVNYIILVFTDVNELKKRRQSFVEYLDKGCPEPLKDIIRLCKGRCVLLDTDTKDEVKTEQVQNLLSQVKTLLAHHDGESLKVDGSTNWYSKGETSMLIQKINKSYEERMTRRIDVVESRLTDTTTRLEQLELPTLKVQERDEEYYKGETSELIQQLSKSYEDQMTQRLEEVESRVKYGTTRLEQKLAEAEAVRLNADERAQETQKNSSEQIQKLKEADERAKEAQKNSSEQIQKLVKDVMTRLEQQLAEAEAARLKADERAEEAQKISSEEIQKLKEAVERAEEVQKNSSEQFQKLVKDVTSRLEQQLAEAEAARLNADERAEEAQKNSSEQN